MERFNEEIEISPERKKETMDGFLKQEEDVCIAALKKEGGNKTLRSRASALLLASLLAVGVAAGTAETVEAGARIRHSGGPTAETMKFDVEKMEQQRRTSYLELKETIEVNKLEEKVNWLKEQHGESLDDWMFTHQIKKAIEFVKKIEEAEKAGEKGIFVNSESPIMMTPGSIVDDFAKGKWKKLSKEEKEAKASTKTEIAGFQEGSLTDQGVEADLRSRCGDVFFSGSVKSINYLPEASGDKNPDYNLQEDYYIIASVPGYSMFSSLYGQGDDRRPISIFKHPEGEGIPTVTESVTHEIAHANDPVNSQVLSSSERIEMFYEISRRAQDEGRLKSKYVEDINNEDKKREKHLRAVEYWAMAVEMFLESPESFSSEHPEDAALVKKWMERINN